MITVDRIKIITTTKTMNKEMTDKDQVYNNQIDQTSKMDHVTKTDAQINRITKKDNDQKAESLLRDAWIYKTHKLKSLEQIKRKIIIKSNLNKKEDKCKAQLEQQVQGKENLKDDITYSETRRPKSEKQTTVAAEIYEVVKKGAERGEKHDNNYPLI